MTSPERFSHLNSRVCPASDRSFPVHQFLLALSPVVFLYLHNTIRLPLALREVIIAAGAVLAGSALIFVLLTLLIGDRLKAALITTAFTLFFFAYGRVLELLRIPAGEPELTMIFWLGFLLAVSWWTIRTRRNLHHLTAVLNLITGAVLLTNILAAIPTFRPTFRTTSLTRVPQTPVRTSELPDIYYIILDSYARSDVLQELYGVDNQPFIDFLTAQGFYVARRSRANYVHTYPSIASALNFMYLDSLARQHKGSRNLAPMVSMIARNRLVSFLREQGYTILTFSSGDAGLVLADADIYLAPRWNLSEFQSILLSTTPLPVLLDIFARRSLADERRSRILYALRNLPRAAQARHPVFVFAHIICPHPPFVFGPDGEPVNPKGIITFTSEDGLQLVGDQRSYRRGYAGQIQYLTREVQQTIREILQRSPQPPVIVLQADHGPASTLRGATLFTQGLHERSAILSAIHLPSRPGTADTAAPLFYDSITPINVFRLILNHLFDTKLPLLPDQTWYSTAQASYEFLSVQDSLQLRRRITDNRLGTVTVIAFPTGFKPRQRPVNYCRRLVARKYPDPRPRLQAYYLFPVDKPLTAEQTQERYRELVANGVLPDLGTAPDTYAQPGPDGNYVSALFFPDTAR